MVALVLDNGTYATVKLKLFPANRAIQENELETILPDANEDVVSSVQRATREVMRYLHHQSAVPLPATMHMNLDFGEFPRISFTGLSAGLAFFAAMTERICRLDFGHLAATGVLGEQGRIERIGGIQEKLRGFLEHSTQPFLFLAPADNAADISEELLQAVTTRNSRIEFVSDLPQCLELLLGTYTLPYGSPYRGLKSFDFQDHDLLFGRGPDKSDVMNILKRLYESVYQRSTEKKHFFLTILGRSGVGKSSFVNAGLLPLLIKPRKIPKHMSDAVPIKGQRHFAIIKPNDHNGQWNVSLASAFYSATSVAPYTQPASDDELTELARACFNDPGKAKQIMQQRLDKLPGDFTADNDNANEKPENCHMMALVIDQFERFFQMSIADDEKNRWIRCLTTLSEKGRHVFLIITSIQSDAYAEFESYPTLLNIIKPGGSGEAFHIQSLSADAPWTDLIQGPARIKGIEFEKHADGSTLADDIRHDIVNLAGQYDLSKNVLPWLQFSLTYLHEQAESRDPDKIVLKLSDYHERLGGIKGALANRAEEIYSTLSDTAKEALNDLLDYLVRFDSRTGKLLVHAVDRKHLPQTAAMQELVTVLIQGNLVTANANRNTDNICIAHHALLETQGDNAWPRIMDWAERSKAKLVRVERVESRFQQYLNAPAKSRKEHLLVKSLLADGKFYISQFPQCKKPIKDFIQASLKRARRRTLILSSVYSVVGLMISGLAVFSLLIFHDKQVAENRSKAQKLTAEANDLLNSDPTLSFQLALASLRIHPAFNAEKALWKAYQRPLASRVLHGHKGGIRNIAISTRNNLVISSSRDKTLRAWDLTSGKLRKTMLKASDLDKVSCLTLANDGTTLYTGHVHGWINVWDLNSFKRVKKVRAHRSPITDIKLSPDGNLLITSGLDKLIIVRDRYTYQELHRLNKEQTTHQAEVTSLAITPDSKILATGSLDRTIKLWDLSSGQVIKTLTGHGDNIRTLAFAANGVTLVSGSDDAKIMIWNLHTGKLIKTLTEHKHSVTHVSITANSKRLYSASSDQTIVLWDLQTGKKLKSFLGHKGPVSTFAISKNGHWLVSGSLDNTIRLWDRRNKSSLRVIRGHSKTISALSISNDMKTLVSGATDKTIRLWDLKDGKQVGKITTRLNWINTVAVSNNRKIVATAGPIDNRIQIWNSKTGTLMHRLAGHKEPIKSLSLSGDGKTLVSGSWDKTVRLWDVESGDLIKQYNNNRQNIFAVAHAKSSPIAVSNSQGANRLRIFDLRTNTTIGTLSDPRKPFYSIAISPDANSLISTTASKNVIRMWDVQTKEVIELETGKRGSIEAVALSRDATLMAFSINKKIVLFPANHKGLLLAIKKNLLPGPKTRLSRAQIKHYLKATPSKSSSSFSP